MIHHIRRVAAPRGLVVSNALGDVAKYLSEAATSIFKPTGDSNVPWDGSGAPFSGTRLLHMMPSWLLMPMHARHRARMARSQMSLCRAGRITHHEEVTRLKRVYELVQEAKQQVSGERPPMYSNFTCVN